MKIFPISNIYGKYSNVSIIETKVVKVKVTIKCDMKTSMSGNFCVAETLLKKLTMPANVMT